MQIMYDFWYDHDYKRRISNIKRLIFITESVSGSSDISVFHMEFMLQWVKFWIFTFLGILHYLDL